MSCSLLAAATQVLYLDVCPDDGLEQLTALAAATRAHFKDAGLLLQADQPFVPHGALTLSDAAGMSKCDCSVGMSDCCADAPWLDASAC